MNKEAGGSKMTQKSSATLYLAAASALLGAIGKSSFMLMLISY